MNKDKLREILTDDINSIRENMFKTLFYIYLYSKVNMSGNCSKYDLKYDENELNLLNDKLNLNIDYDYFESCINYQYVYLLKEQKLIHIDNDVIYLTENGLETIYRKTENIHQLKGNYSTKYPNGNHRYSYLFTPKSETL